MFDIRFCTKYLISPLHVDIIFAFWVAYFSSLTKLLSQCFAYGIYNLFHDPLVIYMAR